MSRRLLLSYLSLTLIVLAVLEVPLGVTYGRNERRALETKVERDAVTVASLSEGILEGKGEIVASRPCERSRADTSATRAAASWSSTGRDARLSIRPRSQATRASRAVRRSPPRSRAALPPAFVTRTR